MKSYFSQEYYLQLFSRPFAAILLLSLIIIASAGILKLNTSANYRVYFDQNDSLLKQEALLNKLYSNGDSLLVMLKSENSLMQDDNWIALNELSNTLLKLKSVTKVTNFLTLARMTDSSPLIDDIENVNEFDASLTQIRGSHELRLAQLAKHPRAYRLISADGKNALFELRINLVNRNSPQEIISISETIGQIVEEFKASNHYITETHLAGVHTLNTDYINLVRHDLKFFIPTLLVIFSLGLFYFFNSIKLVMVTLGLSLASVLSAAGFAGWFGFELAAINAFSPVIIISLSIATSVHILTNYFRYLIQTQKSAPAIEKSLSSNFVAILLSNLTTASGFLLLSTSPSPPIRVVGYMVAFGVVINYLGSQILLPIWLRRTTNPPNVKKLNSLLNRWKLKSLGSKILSFSKPINIAVIGICVISFLSLLRLQVNDNVYQYFDQEHSFSQSIKAIEKHFVAVSNLQFSTDSGSTLGVFDADYLSFLQSFSDWLANQPQVAKVDNLNQLVNSQERSTHSLRRIATSTSVEELGLSHEISHDYRHSKIGVLLTSTSTQDILTLNQNAQQWLSKNSQSYVVIGGVSPDIIFAQLGWRNSTSLFYSLIIALISVAVIAGFIFRSWSFTAMALLCNMIPLAVVFAVWVQIGGYLSLGSSVVMGMIMGILIDDTLHLLIKHHQYNQNRNKEPVLNLYSSVAPAVIITSLTLMTGLLVGLLSDFRPIVELSGLSIATIFVALIIDLIWLPILMNNWRVTNND